MKYFIQYLDFSPVTGALYEPCGDRAVLLLDGRNNLKTMVNDGHKFNGYRRPIYPHFKIMRGTFTNCLEVYSTIRGK
jgi:hypothetical protein